MLGLRGPDRLPYPYPYSAPAPHTSQNHLESQANEIQDVHASAAVRAEAVGVKSNEQMSEVLNSFVDPYPHPSILPSQ